jgi:hypothetical protein
MLLAVMSFAVAPAFAGYESTDVMLDQADHTTFIGFDYGLMGSGADENGEPYGPATIVIPYVGLYGFQGCPSIYDTDGALVPTSYNCNLEPEDLADNQDASLIIQDMFAMVTEGELTPKAGVEWLSSGWGITQVLDSLFAAANNVSGQNYNAIYVDQTLDQDLANLDPSTGIGIAQRLHSAFDLNDPSGVPEPDSIDQTIAAYMFEESGDTIGTSGLTASGVVPGYVQSYMAQWFQKGEDHTCQNAVGVSCNHVESGGHGDVTGTIYIPDVEGHDP